MAAVYLAHDLRHDRKVAVKVLRPELAAALGPERFLKEIAITAQLDHPHILALLDSGTADGVLYYVMPLVEGESLRERLTREKQLSLDDALRIAREVAEALSYAHGRGVIHRDIKPENILLSGGYARVADFGIARAVSEAGGAALTQTGLIVGTPPYMSPEQVAGERALDGRSDLYALGCVLHEMLAGQPPFTGPTMENLAYQHLTVAPPPVTQFRASVPEGIAVALRRVLAKAPADRFETAERFSQALSQAGAASPVSTPTRSPRRVAILSVVMVVAVVAVALLLRRPPAGPTDRPSVAVLPFRNLGPPSDEYFADGITEEISSRLAQISGLTVISRASAIRYKGSDRSPRDIARELGVQYVLEGTIRTDRRPDGTGQVRVAPQLVKVEGTADLPMEAYTTGLTPGEVFQTQSRIAERVAQALDVTLLAQERRTVRRSETVDARAHDEYMLGRFHWNQATASGIEEASSYFESAVARDSQYARAFAGLADAYAQVSFFPEIALPIPEAYARAEVAARRAIELDSGLAEAHASLGFILGNGRRDWGGAERELLGAVELNRDYAPAHLWYSDLLSLQKRYPEALIEANRAVQLEPTAPTSRHSRAVVLAYLGRYDEAAASERVALSLQPSFIMPHVWIAQIAVLRGNRGEMARELGEIAPLMGRSGAPRVAQAFAAYAKDSSRKADVIAAIGALVSANQGLNAARQAWMYSAVGAMDSALATLQRTARSRSAPGLAVLRFPSVVQTLGGSPGYLALLADVGLKP